MIVIIAVILIALYAAYKIYSTNKVDKQLDGLLKQKHVILDVRTPGEFSGGHIEGAVNIPLSQLRTVEMPMDKNAVIITCCSHGLRSVKAVEILKNRGFVNAHNGGAWSELEKHLK
ncbi:rhodanese-like domain-containing protein [Taibaiella soli]|nr:rhodanese-like domain-containing protein [Taibaiella soli]